MAFMSVLFKGKQPYIANVATTILGFVYCGWFPLHLLFLRDLGSHPVYQGFIKQNVTTEGAGYALLLFFAVILTDSFCYYAGSKFGKHKLSKVISPNKTIEGSIGGGIVRTGRGIVRAGGGCLRLGAAAGGKGQRHGRSQNKSEQFLFHSDLLLLSVSGRIHKVGCLPKNKGGSVRGTEPPRV